MSPLRTSSPWTTPTTPLGARILSQEPATVDAIPTMTLTEMEATLAALAPRSTEAAERSGRGVRRSRSVEAPRRRPSGWRVAVVAAVLVAVAGGGSGLAVGLARSARPQPVAAAAASSTEANGSPGGPPAPGVAAAWGEAVALSASSLARAGSAEDEPEATLLPASVVRVHASLVDDGPTTPPGAAGSAMGRLAGGVATAPTTLVATSP